MNKLMKEQEARNDKSKVFSFGSSFSLRYELLRNCEQVGIALFTAILVLSVDIKLWEYVFLGACVFVIYGVCYLLYLKYKIPKTICTFYKTKVVVTRGKSKKKTREISYSDIQEISYKQGNINKLFKNGTIIITQNTRNLLEKNIYIESVKNVENVFEKIKEIYN